MRRSALLVVPSRRETFSLVTAEALASGTPVVATECGGPEEILTDDTGQLAQVNDRPRWRLPSRPALAARSIDRRFGVMQSSGSESRLPLERLGRCMSGHGARARQARRRRYRDRASTQSRRRTGPCGIRGGGGAA